MGSRKNHGRVVRIKTDKERLKDRVLEEREAQRRLRERHGVPNLSLIEEFLSLPYWARYDLDNTSTNSAFYSWVLDHDLFDRKPHKIHKCIEADFYTHPAYVMESMVTKPIHWYVRGTPGRTAATLSIPCDHEYVIKSIFDMIARIDMDITSFGVDSESKTVHILLDGTHRMEESFNDEYQAIMKLYRFVWELHNEIFCPSLSDLKGQYDITYDDDAGENYIELFDVVALGSFMQDYNKFARRGVLLPLNQIRSIQNSYLYDNSNLGVIELGKATLLEGDFIICYALNKLS
jgi:hypothetical protein